MTLDGTRLLELHSSVYVASAMSHREWNHICTISQISLKPLKDIFLVVEYLHVSS